MTAAPLGTTTGTDPGEQLKAHRSDAAAHRFDM
jgi:hypothetical protein